jgi:hypothetical protein
MGTVRKVFKFCSIIMETDLMIKVRKVSDDLYYVSAIPPRWRGGEAWSLAEPLSANQIAKELFDRGFHQQDIGDAIYEADQIGVEKSSQSCTRAGAPHLNKKE